MDTFFSLLEQRVADCRSMLCVGLDPRPEDLSAAAPDSVAEAALAFCLDQVHKTKEFAAAFKPNAAFFERMGGPGWEALRVLIAAIKQMAEQMGSPIPVILDAKRGDIASSAQAYACSAFEVLGADALTVNPYLGEDSIRPFTQDPRRGVFLLCKTSNPGSKDLQDAPVYGIPLYEHLARLAQSWNQHGNIGLVTGATHPQALQRIREAAPDLWFLAPGVGFQGANLEETLRAGLRSDGRGLLINISRGLTQAEDPARAAQNVRDEMLRIRAQIQSERAKTVFAPGFDSAKRSLAAGLLESGCVKFGRYTLKSGRISPIYLDLRRLVGYPGLLSQVALAYIQLLQPLKFDRLAALPYAAIPIGTAISLAGGYPLIYPRKEAKAYGTQAEIEGVFNPGEEVVVIDDLATTGESKFEAIEKLTRAGLKVRHLAVLIDRQSGARQAIESAGYQFHSVLTLTELLDYWEVTHRVPPEQIEATRNFLAGG